MRLRKQRIHGVTAYREPAEVDFDALPDGLIAVVGRNGSGKSTLLEAAMAAIDKQLVTRSGSLYDRCSGSDAYIEATYDDRGHEIVARVQVDAERRTTEGYVFRDGQPITDGKAGTFAEMSASIFGSRALRLAGVFAAQDKAGDFLRAPRAERKRLFAELLDTAALETLAEQARKALASAEGDLAVAARDVARLTAETAGLADHEAALETAVAEVRTATAKAEEARMASADAEALLARLRAEEAAIAEVATAAKVAADAANAARLNVARNDEDGVRATERAAERRRFLAALDLDSEERGIRSRSAAEVEEIEWRAADLAAAIEEIGDVDALREQLEGVRSKVAAVKAVIDRAARLDAEAATARGVIATETTRVNLLEQRQKAEQEELSRRSELLETVPCTASAAWIGPLTTSPGRDLAGTCPLLADARAARERAQRPAEPIDRKALDAALVVAADLAAERKALVIDDLLPLEQEELRLVAEVVRADRLPELRSEWERCGEARGAAERRLADAIAALAVERGKALAAEATIASDLEAELEQVAEARERLGAAAAAAGDAAMAAAARLQEANQRIAGLPTAVLDAGAASRHASDAAGALTIAIQAEATERAAVQTLRQRAGELFTAQARQTGAMQDTGDWYLLAQALGKDGVQALEIDAAAPEISALVNELLASCYGPRFSVQFETLREKRSAPGEYTEVFDVRVYDGAASRTVEDLSGGEKVIIGEAVGLAIAIYNARKSAVKWETLWRDETAGALDPENALHYVQMLRRARELCGARQVIFVAHQPEVWEQADARILVESGTVRVKRAQVAA